MSSHWQSLEQEREASVLGMWVFLATEVLLFGGLFTAYTVYRTVYPLVFAEGSRQLDVVLGGINTVVLLGSSGTLAIGVERARRDARPRLWLLLTALLGIAFLAIKAVEYQRHLRVGLVSGTELFIVAYFTMTGLHTLHLTIGVVVVGVLAMRSPRPLVYELAGLYWHFVDVVWIFLVALLYLVDWPPFVTLGLASAIAVLGAWFIMGLRRTRGVPRLVAAAGVVWLAILIAGTLDDVLTRNWLPLPGK
ncbi:MAG TPA: cytochrome c oxidase subunit 3 [Chloroflexota bacterium]|jgi:cytochrome c oxidase subunit 3